MGLKILGPCESLKKRSTKSLVVDFSSPLLILKQSKKLFFFLGALFMKTRSLSLLLLLSACTQIHANPPKTLITLRNNTDQLIYARAKFQQPAEEATRFGSAHFNCDGQTTDSLPAGSPHKKEDTLFVENGCIDSGDATTLTINPEELTLWDREEVSPEGASKVLSPSKVLVNRDGKTICIKGTRLGRKNAGLVATAAYFLRKLKVKVPKNTVEICDVITLTNRGSEICQKTFNGKCLGGHNCALFKANKNSLEANDKHFFFVVNENNKNEVSIELEKTENIN